MAVTIRHCRCTARADAEADRSFIYDPANRVYVMPEAPLRAMSARARYLAFHERVEHPHADHSGEHYQHVTCPWCGADLPGCQLDPPRIPDTLTEPEE